MMCHVKHPEDLPLFSPPIVGKIDYLARSGAVAYSHEYREESELIKEILECTDCGIPVSVTLYRDRSGKTISRSFVDDLSSPILGLYETDCPYS